MKKLLSFVIVIAVMVSLSVSAFAIGSPTANTDGGTGDEFSVVDPSNPDGEALAISADAVKTVAIDKADELLNEEDAEAFKAAYEEAMATEGRKVYKCFWLYIDEELAGANFKGLSKDSALAYKFTCPGKDVKCLVNGNEMEVEHIKGSSYVAYLTEVGTVTITCAE